MSGDGGGGGEGSGDIGCGGGGGSLAVADAQARSTRKHFSGPCLWLSTSAAVHDAGDCDDNHK